MILAINNSIGRSRRSRTDRRGKSTLNYCSDFARWRQESVGGIHHTLLVWSCRIRPEWQTRRTETPPALVRAQEEFRTRIDANRAKITVAGRAGVGVEIDPI